MNLPKDVPQSPYVLKNNFLAIPEQNGEQRISFSKDTIWSRIKWFFGQASAFKITMGDETTTIYLNAKQLREFLNAHRTEREQVAPGEYKLARALALILAERTKIKQPRPAAPDIPPQPAQAVHKIEDPAATAEPKAKSSTSTDTASHTDTTPSSAQKEPKKSGVEPSTQVELVVQNMSNLRFVLTPPMALPSSTEVANDRTALLRKGSTSIPKDPEALLLHNAGLQVSEAVLKKSTCREDVIQHLISVNTRLPVTPHAMDLSNPSDVEQIQYLLAIKQGMEKQRPWLKENFFEYPRHSESETGRPSSIKESDETKRLRLQLQDVEQAIPRAPKRASFKTALEQLAPKIGLTIPLTAWNPKIGWPDIVKRIADANPDKHIIIPQETGLSLIPFLLEVQQKILPVTAGGTETTRLFQRPAPSPSQSQEGQLKPSAIQFTTPTPPALEIKTPSPFVDPEKIIPNGEPKPLWKRILGRGIQWFKIISIFLSAPF